MRRAKRWIGGTLALGIVAIVGLVAYGLHEATAMPIMRQAEVNLKGLAPGQAPFRIALLSDIHIGNRAMSSARLEAIVAEVNRMSPDLVVITGDFVNGASGRLDSDPAQLTAPLSQLRAGSGVLATMGNHEHWTDPEAVAEALTNAGITVLANQPVVRGPVTILGIDDDYSGHADIAATLSRMPADAVQPLVAMSHSPDIAERLPDDVGLLLAGHTHCGQVVLPVIGGLAPVFGKLIGDRHYYQTRFRCGVVRERRTTTIVTAGVGSGAIPLRIGASPDWWLVTVRPASPGGNAGYPPI